MKKIFLFFILCIVQISSAQANFFLDKCERFKAGEGSNIYWGQYVYPETVKTLLKLVEIEYRVYKLIDCSLALQRLQQLKTVKIIYSGQRFDEYQFMDAFLKLETFIQSMGEAHDLCEADLTHLKSLKAFRIQTHFSTVGNGIRDCGITKLASEIPQLEDLKGYFVVTDFKPLENFKNLQSLHILSEKLDNFTRPKVKLENLEFLMLECFGAACPLENSFKLELFPSLRNLILERAPIDYGTVLQIEDRVDINFIRK